MFRIIERSQSSQMDLRSLPVSFPVCQPLVDQFLSMLVNLPIDFDDLHALPLCVVDLPPHGLVIFLGVDLCGIEPLLNDGTDGAPPQLVRQDALARIVHARPDGFEFLLILNVVKVRPDHPRCLLGVAHRVSERDRELVLLNITDCSSCFRISPHGPKRIKPTCVCGVAISGD